jgi:hypothetical protein
VDLELVAPSDQRVVLQLKAPDQSGVVAHYRIADGEYDERVLTAIANARDQLVGAQQPSMIVVCAQRLGSVAAHSDFATTRLLGISHQVDGLLVYPRDELGCFACDAWRHIGAVALLDHLRGERLL